MPTYSYDCGRCGGFDRVRRVAQRDTPIACPACGETAVRTLAAPGLALMGADRRGLIRAEEKNAGYARLRHPIGCSCCR